MAFELSERQCNEGIGNHYMIEESTARFQSQQHLVVLYMDHKGLALY